VITVHLDNGTSHSFPVPDARHVLRAFEEAVKSDKGFFWVDTSSVFQTSKVAFVTYGRLSP
jgi:hypothetical protein